MAEHRTISRAGGESDTQRAADFARDGRSDRRSSATSKTDVLTELHALEDLGDGTFLAKLRESPFYPAGGGQVSDQGVDRARRRPGRRAPSSSQAHRVGDDQVLVFRGDRLRGRRPRAGRSSRGASASRRWRTTPPRICCRRRSARCSASTSSRPARPSGPTSSGSTSRTAQQLTADERDAGRAARQPRDLREPPAARLRDADRRGAQARRDDAVRGEVRRHRPRRRDRGRLARALRRHPRALDGRDRRRSRSSPRARSAPARAGSRPSPRARRGRSCTAARASSTPSAPSSRRLRKELKRKPAAGGGGRRGRGDGRAPRTAST